MFFHTPPFFNILLNMLSFSPPTLTHSYLVPNLFFPSPSALRRSLSSPRLCKHTLACTMYISPLPWHVSNFTTLTYMYIIILSQLGDSLIVIFPSQPTWLSAYTLLPVVRYISHHAIGTRVRIPAGSKVSTLLYT